MVKCPFCGFDNEDGALFCEQCKSDLSSVPSTPAASSEPAEAIPVVIPEAEPLAAAEIVEAIPAAVEAIPAVEALPDEMPVEVAPMAEAVPAMALAVEPAPAIPVFEASPVVVPTVPVPAAIVPAAPVATPPNPAVAEEPPMAVPAAPVIPAPAPPTAGAPATGASAGFGPGSQPRLIVMRGQKIGVEFPIYPDYNYVGRADDKPVDIDLEDQEPPDRVWCSRQHAVLHFDDGAGVITIEDLNSSNGTYVNRARVYPGQKKQLLPNDVVQIGTVHLKLKG